MPKDLSQLITRNDNGRLSRREFVVSAASYHLSQLLHKQIVSWVVVSGLLAGGLAFQLVWWSFIAVIGYVWWLTRSRPVAAMPGPLALGEQTGEAELPPISWIDVMPEDDDFRAAMATLMPDQGAALMNGYMPHRTQAALSATRQLLRVLSAQRKLPQDTGVLIAYASDFDFLVAMIPLTDASVQLQSLPPAPARVVVESDDGPWLLVALGRERPLIRTSYPTPAQAARVAPSAPPLERARPTSTGTTALDLSLPTAPATPPAHIASPSPTPSASSAGGWAGDTLAGGGMFVALPNMPSPAQAASPAQRPSARSADDPAGEALFAALMSSAPPRAKVDPQEAAVLRARASSTPAAANGAPQRGTTTAARMARADAAITWDEPAPPQTAPALADTRRSTTIERASVPAVVSQLRETDVILGYNRDTGEPVTMPIAAFSGILAVAFGIPRTGKTSSLEGLVQRTSRRGMPWGIAYDSKPEWHGLRCAVNPAEALPLVILGDGVNADVQLPVAGLAPTLLDLPEKADEKRDRMERMSQTLTAWQRAIEWLMEHQQGWICDLSSERIGMEGSSRVLTAVFLAAVRSARRHRRPFGILIDEAQNALPQSRMRKQLWEAAMGITRTAPSLGVTTFLAAHRPSDVDKDLIAPARLRILHRVDLPLDIEAYTRMLPWPSDQVQRIVESLRPGEAIVYGPGLLNSGDVPIVVQMIPATTFHVGYTPAIGVPVPVAPPRIPIDGTLLEAIAQIPGVMMPRRTNATPSLPAPTAPDPAPAQPVLASTPITGHLELLDPQRWPEEVRGAIATTLRHPAAQDLVLRAGEIGIIMPVREEQTGQALGRQARLALLARPELRALLTAARRSGVEQKPLARLLFGIADPGRAGNEIGLAINAWETQLGDEATGVSSTEDLADDD